MDCFTCQHGNIISSMIGSSQNDVLRKRNRIIGEPVEACVPRGKQLILRFLLDFIRLYDTSEVFCGLRWTLADFQAFRDISRFFFEAFYDFLLAGPGAEDAAGSIYAAKDATANSGCL